MNIGKYLYSYFQSPTATNTTTTTTTTSTTTAATTALMTNVATTQTQTVIPKDVANTIANAVPQPIVAEDKPLQVTNKTSNESVISQKAVEVLVKKPTVEQILEREIVIKNQLHLFKSEESDEDSDETSMEVELNSIEDILMHVGVLVNEGSSIHDFSKLFYNQLEKMMATKSVDDNLDLLFSIIVDTDGIEELLNKIVIGENSTLNGPQPKFLNKLQKEQLKNNLFGPDLQEFLINITPLNNLTNLQSYLDFFETSGLFTSQNLDNIKSSIFCMLCKKLIRDYKISANNDHSLKNLLTSIKFLETYVKNGGSVPKSSLIDNTLAVENSDIEASFNDEDDFEIEDDSYEVIDYLKKLAAYYSLKEYQPKKLEINSFIAMLKEVDVLLQNIDEDHQLMPHFYKIGAEIIERYTDDLQIFDIVNLNKLKNVYNQVFKKIKHEELIIEQVIEDDMEIAESLQKSENANISQNDFLVAQQLARQVTQQMNYGHGNDFDNHINNYTRQGLSYQDAMQIVMNEMNL